MTSRRDNSKAAPRPRRVLRQLAWAAAVLVALLLLAALALPHAVNRGWFNGLVQRRLSEATGFEVRFSKLEMRGYRFAAVNGLEVFGKSGIEERPAFATVERVEAEFLLREVLGGRLDTVRIKRAEVNWPESESSIASDRTRPPRAASSVINLAELLRFRLLEVSDSNLRVTMKGESISARGVQARLDIVPDNNTKIARVALEARTESASGGLTGGEQAFSIERLSLTGSADVNAATGALDGGQATLTLALAPDASVAASAKFEKGALLDLKANIRGLDIADITATFGGILSAAVVGAEPEGRLNVSLASDRINFDGESPRGKVGVSAEAELAGFAVDMGGRKVRVSNVGLKNEATISFGKSFTDATVELSTAIHHPEVKIGDAKYSFADKTVNLKGSGRLNLEKGEASGLSASVELPEIGKVTVSDATVHFGENLTAGGKVEAVCDLKGVAQEFKRLGISLPVEMDGKLSARAQLTLSKDEILAEGRSDLSEGSCAADASVLLGARATDWGIRKIRLSDSWAKMDFSVKSPLDDFTKGQGTFKVTAGAKTADVDSAPGKETASGIRVDARAASSLDGKRVRLDHAALAIDKAWGAKAEASLSLDEKKRGSGTASVSDLDVAEVLQRLVSYLPALKTHYKPSGKLSVAGKLSFGGESHTAELDVTADKLSVVSSRMDLPSGVEDLSLHSTVKLSVPDDFKSVRFASETRLANAVVYHDTLFKEFPGQAAIVKASGLFNTQTRQLTEGRFEMKAGEALGVVASDVSASAHPMAFAGNVRLSVKDAGALFSVARERYEITYPILKTAAVSGAFAVTGDVIFNKEQAGISGRVELERFGVSIADIKVEDVSGPIPFAVRKQFEGAAPPAAAAPQPGAGLTIKRIDTGAVVLNNLRCNPAIQSNLLVLLPPQADGSGERPVLETDLFGGKLRLWSLQTGDLLTRPIRCDAAFSVEGLDTEQALRAFNAPAYAGRLDSNRCSLTFAEGDLKIQGQLKASICDGELVFSDIKAYNILRPGPVFGFDLEIARINLQQLTSQLHGFGLVTGILEGHARRVLIQEGRPYSLDLDLHTVPTKGIPQTVDSAAVQSLVILSTGAPQPTITSLMIFGSIKYKVCGLECQINDDAVTIRGARQRGEEQIIFETAFGAVPQLQITVVTGRPISYDDIVSRLKAAAAHAREKAGEGK